MQRPLKTTLLLFPLLLCLIAIFSLRLSQSHVNQWLYPVEDAFVGAPGEPIRAELSLLQDGEVQIHELTLRNSDGEPLEQRTITFDRDYFGGGFVAAMQADDDAELEIVVADVRYRGNNYYLDVEAKGEGASRILQKPHDQASPLTRERIDAWESAGRVTPAHGILSLVIVATVLFYVLYLPYLIIRSIANTFRIAPPKEDDAIVSQQRRSRGE